MTRQSQLDSIANVAHLVAAMGVVAALYFGRDVFIPLTLAVLLAFLLSPLVNRIQRMGIGNTLAVMITALCAFVFMAGTLTLVGRELSNLLTEIPQYKEELVSKARGLAGLSSGMGDSLGELADEVTQAIEKPSDEVSTEPTSKPATTTQDGIETIPRDANLNPVQKWASAIFASSPASRPTNVHDGSSPASPIYTVPVAKQNLALSWAGTVGSILGPLGTVGLVSVFVLFLLIHRDDMRDRMIKVISRGNYVTTTDALQEVSQRISKYLVAQTIVNVSYGLVMSLGLFIIGKCLAPDGHFPNYILWGVLAGLLRFVPYVGPVVSAAFPILISIAVFPGYSVTIAAISLIIALELVSNNVIEPWLYSTSSGISAIAVIGAAVFWGWLWGPVGLLLSTPLTVCLVVLGRHVARFRVFATLLGESSNISPWQRYYQRLLSGDTHKAKEFLASQIQTDSGITTIDRILVPTLRRVRSDYEVREHLTPQESNELLTSIATNIEELSWEPVLEKSSDQPAVSPDEDSNFGPVVPARLTIAGCAAHHAAEELLLTTLSKSEPMLNLNVIDSNLLPDGIATAAIEREPSAILILVLPTGGFSQARYLCRTLRDRKYDGTIIVCCCGKFRHFDRLFVKFRKAGANFMTTSVAQTALKLRTLLPKDSAAVVQIDPEFAA